MENANRKCRKSKLGKHSQACGAVSKLDTADMKILCLMNFSLFHSHIQYCIIDWGKALKTVVRPVQVLQTESLKYMHLEIEHQVQKIFSNYLMFSKFLICTNLIWTNLCISIMPITYPHILITFLRNCTAYMIMAQNNTFRNIFIIDMIELIIVKHFCYLFSVSLRFELKFLPQLYYWSFTVIK